MNGPRLTSSIRIATALSLVLLLLTSCGLFRSERDGRTPMDDVPHLRVGMQASDLVDRIGSPNSVRDEPDGSERWTYVYGRRAERVNGMSKLVVHVREGQVRTWEERPAE